MKISEIKTALIDLGVDAVFIDIHEGEVSVEYHALEAADTPELQAFIAAQSVMYTDRSLFIAA